MALVRLNKLLSERGLASRRKADEWIAQGLIQVNGKRVFELGQRVDPSKDRIVVQGKPLKPVQEKMYIMLHKPRGFVTTLSDPQGRPTVIDLLRKLKTRVYPVGRLDYDSEGLLLLTNDGEYANRVMTPKFGVTKTYLVRTVRDLSASQIQKLLRGVSLPASGKVRALHLSRAKVEGAKQSSEGRWWKIIIDEGKNRQIRKMFENLEIDVVKLRRISIGRLKLGRLPRGEFVFLNSAAAESVFLADPALSPVQKSNRKSDKVSGQNGSDSSD